MMDDDGGMGRWMEVRTNLFTLFAVHCCHWLFRVFPPLLTRHCVVDRKSTNLRHANKWMRWANKVSLRRRGSSHKSSGCSSRLPPPGRPPAAPFYRLSCIISCDNVLLLSTFLLAAAAFQTRLFAFLLAPSLTPLPPLPASCSPAPSVTWPNSSLPPLPHPPFLLWLHCFAFSSPEPKENLFSRAWLLCSSRINSVKGPPPQKK